MIVGDLLLVMAGDPYFGPPIARASLRGIFSVQVTNKVGAALSLDVIVEHRNQEDTAWATAGTFPAIVGPGTFMLDVAGLKELVRYKFQFTAGGATDGVYLFAAAPQWLRD